MGALVGVYSPGASMDWEIPMETAYSDLSGGSRLLSKEEKGSYFEIRALDTPNERVGWHREEGILVVFNGRLFPGVENCAEFLARGYGERGGDILNDLNGEFLACIIDEDRKKFILAKDHFGSHPAYHRTVEGATFFCTAFRPLARLEPAPSIDKTALIELLIEGKVGSSRTILEEIRKVRAGTWLEIGAGGFRENIYWDVMDFVLRREPGVIGQDEFLKNLKGAIADRMEGLHSPYFSYLSGGIDSTMVGDVISGILRERGESDPLITLSYGIAQKGWNEKEFALMASRKMGSNHRSGEIALEEFTDRLFEAIEIAEESAKGDNGLPYYCAAKMAGEIGAEFIFSGDGADGSFGGRPSLLDAVATDIVYSALRLGMIDRNGRSLLMNYLRELFRPGEFGAGWMKNGFRLAKSLLDGAVPGYLLRRRFLESAAETRRLVSTGFVSREEWDEAIGTIREELEEAYRQGFFNAYRIMSFRKSDPSRFRALWNWHQSASVVPTYPFMDRRVCEPMLSRAPSAFYRKARTKDFLRTILEEKGYPEELSRRRKTGFFVPLMMWYQGELRNFAEKMLLEGYIHDSGMFDDERVKGLLSDIPDNWTTIGTLINLEIWNRVTFGKQK